MRLQGVIAAIPTPIDEGGQSLNPGRFGGINDRSDLDHCDTALEGEVPA